MLFGLAVLLKGEKVQITSAFPAEWRADTLPVPRELLRPIVSAWIQYKTAPTGKTFGECMSLEGGGQGSPPPTKRALENQNKSKSYAFDVLVEYLRANMDGKPISILPPSILLQNEGSLARRP